jgi:ferritin
MESLLTEVEVKELNKFGKLELTASQTYLHLTNRMKSLGYFGAEKFFANESKDERKHYAKHEDFMNKMNNELTTEALDAVTSEVLSIKDALELAYEMEKDLMLEYEKSARRTDLSLKVVLLLQGFVEIQVDAVGEYGDLLNRLALTDNMLLFDQELGK